MDKKPPINSFLKSPIQKEDLEKTKNQDIWDLLKGKDGKDGRDGKDGVQGISGFRGFDGDDGKDGKNGKDGVDGKPGPRGPKGEKGLDGIYGKDGINGKDGSPDTADQVVTKVNKAKVKIKKSSIEGFDDIESLAKSANDKVKKYLLMGGSTLTKVQINGLASGDFSTINIIGGTVTNVGGTLTVTIPSAAGLSVIAVTGTVDDSNVTFTSASLPTLLNINGAFYQQTGGSITWSRSGTTITLSSPVGTGGQIFGI